MKIKNLTIKNFKAFYGEYNFDFDGKNILIYGENGSGKSSLYWALYHIFYSFNKPRNILGYKNIFSKEEPLIKLEFDNSESITYENKKFKFSNTHLTDLCKKITKLKLFLSYKDTFLLNELFDYNISKDTFLGILSTLYQGDVKALIDNYISKQKELDKKTKSLKCNINETIIEFQNNLKNNSLIDDITNELNQYEDIKKYDKEGDFIGYETVYYFSDDFISEVESLIEEIKQIEQILDIDSDIYKEFMDELYDYVAIIKEKSEDRYDNVSLVRDKLEIESLDSFELLKTHFQDFLDLIVISNEYKQSIEALNTEVSNKLKTQIENINNIIQKDFEYNNIDFSFDEQIKIINEDKHNPLKPIIKINEKKINKNHLKFLNEAKLSSINIAFYLSIILSYAELSEFKILVIDDLLLSLDLSNRHNFLNLLLKYFNDYQIILLTHDKAFFEVAKRVFDYKQKDKWKYYEMYLDIKNRISSLKFTSTSYYSLLQTKPINPFPIVPIECPYIKRDQSFYDRANQYYKNKDYPAAATYLRKEVERLYHQKLDLGKLESIVEISRKLDNYKELEKCFPPLIRALKAFDKCKDIPERVRVKKCVEFSQKVKKALDEVFAIIDQDTFFNIGLIKDNILNPQSHYDFTRPLYKKELEDAFKAIKLLQQAVEKNILIRISKKRNMQKNNRYKKNTIKEQMINKRKIKYYKKIKNS